MNMNAALAAPIFTPLDRLKGLLEDWAVWTEGYRPGLSARAASIIQTAGSHDFESLFAGVEKQMMKAIDAAIDDLPPAQGAAINKRYLGIDWRFPRDNYAVMLDLAHDTLLVTLPKRNVLIV